ncbi:hypothetical protein JCM10207_000782 [Rhodosporidiobolus poonsookiae]
MAATAAASHPLSASSKTWAPPDFSAERRAFKPSTSSPAFVLPLSFPPDEEKGHSLRSVSQSGLLPSFLPPSDGDAEPFSTRDGVIQPARPHLLFNSLRLDDADDDEDSMFEQWAGDGGAAAVLMGEEGESDDPKERWLVEAIPPPRPRGDDWNKALDAAVMKANGMVDMSDRGLVEVPNSIWELSTLRALPPTPKTSAFSRTQTLPASPTSPLRTPRRSFARNASGTLNSPQPVAQTAVPLTIILAKNELTAGSLSNALWSLGNTISLSLRANRLEHVPEGVGRLSRLEELNVAGNLLRYLPAEILELDNLKKLFLYPNPFLPPPTSAATSSLDAAIDTSSSSAPKKRLLGPLVTHYEVPSLFETTVRRLLSPLSASPTPAPSPTFRAIEQYDRSSLLDLRAARPHLLDPFLAVLYPPTNPHSALSASTSSSTHGSPGHSSSAYAFTRARHASAPASGLAGSTSAPPPSAVVQPFDPLSNVCTSPAHEGDERVYYAPAVERMEWVSEAQLRPAADEAERAKLSRVRCIPIRHRGCGKTCLDWLEEDVEEEEEAGEPVVRVEEA